MKCALDKKYIADITTDLIVRNYVVTTTAKVGNGIYMNDGSGTFVALNVETNSADYFVRLSDDEGRTWTEEHVDLRFFSANGQVRRVWYSGGQPD